MRANSRALSTIPSGVSPNRFMMRSLRLPWFVPMRIAMPRSLQSRTSGVNRSRILSISAAYSASVYSRTLNFFESAKFPGLIRTFSTHFAASSAASGLKWMSATSGTPQPAARNSAPMPSRFLASFTVGAVIRTISQPAFANPSDSATHAAVSIVSLVSIDWMRSGLSPPTAVPPTFTARLRRRPGWLLKTDIRYLVDSAAVAFGATMSPTS